MARRKEHPFCDYLDDEMEWYSALEGVPSKKALDELEKNLHIKLPLQYGQFQLLHGSVLVTASEKIWPRAKLGSVGPYWTFLSGFFVLGLGKDTPDYMNIRLATSEFHREFPEASHLVPFFSYVDNADFFCFDNKGKIHSWSHDVPDESEKAATTFDKFLLTETKQLVGRKNAVKEARSGFGKKWRDHAKYPKRPKGIRK